VLSRDTVFTFTFNERPTSLEVDKNGWILRFPITLDYNEKLQHQRYQYRLLQNYPNPFNPSTTIEYELAKPSSIELSVYDALGRKVATLVNEPQSAGMHRVQFSAENLSSGVYFYKLTAGEFSETRKLMLIK
jgi:hypothetical protein